MAANITNMRLRLIHVPDRLWADHTLPEGAKMVWCYLCALIHTRTIFTPKEIYRMVGISRHSLHHYLDILQAAGWLTFDRPALRTIRVALHTPRDGGYLILPSDVIFDLRIPRGACWTWGVIFRLGGQFTHQDLRTATGYSSDKLRRHIQHLTAHRWLVGGPQRRANKTVYVFRGANPHAVKRAAELRELERGLRVARETPGYSAGQFILARMIRAMSPGIRMIENAELTGLDNAETGGRMHCDLLFPDHNLVVEFHGYQHAGPTELYPDVEEFQALRRRDLLKRGLCQEMGLELVVVWPQNLSRDGIRRLLGHRLPFRDDVEEQWHIIEFLDRKAAQYRRAAGKAPYGNSRG